jgi:hypothetical protein
MIINEILNVVEVPWLRFENLKNLKIWKWAFMLLSYYNIIILKFN